LCETLTRWTFSQLTWSGRGPPGGVFARSLGRPPGGLRLFGTIPLTVHAVIQGGYGYGSRTHDLPSSLRPLAPATPRRTPFAAAFRRHHGVPLCQW
jgi:hypothetical protein